MSTLFELSYSSNRPLEHICRGGSVCDYDVIHNNTRAFLVNGSLILPTRYPLTAGILRRCVTPDFRKAHRRLNPSNLKCPVVVPKTTIVPQRVGMLLYTAITKRAMNCSFFSSPDIINRHQ